MILSAVSARTLIFAIVVLIPTTAVVVEKAHAFLLGRVLVVPNPLNCVVMFLTLVDAGKNSFQMSLVRLVGVLATMSSTVTCWLWPSALSVI
jgi:hypothetical protein